MKIISRLVSSFAAFIAVAFSPMAVGQVPGPAPGVPLPPDARPINFSGGLTLQLSTSAHKVVQPTAANPLAFANDTPQRASFTASAALANRSNTGITFTFPDGASAAAKFEFVLNDKDGNEVWHSDEGAGVLALTEVTLKRGAVWRRTVRVPLVIEGEPLGVGNYTLVAFTDANKQVLAQTLLEVVAPPTVPAKGKIDGTVLKVTSTEPEVTEPAANAWVTVQQLVTVAGAHGAAPFYWSGRADANGKFAVDVPAGRYRVTAGENTIIALPGAVGANALPPTYLPKSVEVTVASGETVAVVIKLTKAPQPVVQGIKGLVVTATRPEGANALVEVPVAGARVEVTEIIDGPIFGGPANGGIIRAPFSWVGTTNNEGRFEVKTPVGKFHIVATKIVLNDPNGPVVQVLGFGGAILPPPNPGTTLTGSADVAVDTGKFSDVKITLKPIIFIGPAGN